MTDNEREQQIREQVSKKFWTFNKQDAVHILAQLDAARVEVSRFKNQTNHLYTDGMIAHRWFAKHFGTMMDGRDFAIKCPMADEALEQTRKEHEQKCWDYRIEIGKLDDLVLSYAQKMMYLKEEIVARDRAMLNRMERSSDAADTMRDEGYRSPNQNG